MQNLNRDQELVRNSNLDVNIILSLRFDKDQNFVFY